MVLPKSWKGSLVVKSKISRFQNKSCEIFDFTTKEPFHDFGKIAVFRKIIEFQKWFCSSVRGGTRDTLFYATEEDTLPQISRVSSNVGDAGTPPPLVDETIWSCKPDNARVYTWSVSTFSWFLVENGMRLLVGGRQINKCSVILANLHSSQIALVYGSVMIVFTRAHHYKHDFYAVLSWYCNILIR